MDLSHVSSVKSILSQAGLTPKKHLGQNFLVSRKVLQGFLEACELMADDAVLEVGSGLGTVTVELARRVKEVVTVEIDRNLCKLLQQGLKQGRYSNVQALCGDILKDSIWLILTSKLEPPRTTFKVVGAIPYQITSPLLQKALTAERSPDLICFIVQRELAQKIVARPPRASYLSNLVALFGQAEVVGKTIAPSAFWPQPKVQSAILRIRPAYPDSLGLEKLDLGNFSHFLHHGFVSPRKMLKKVFGQEQLEKAGINPAKRPQELQLQDWLKLYKIEYRRHKALNARSTSSTGRYGDTGLKTD